MALEDGHHDREMRSHWWWRPGWRVGRKAYTFHVTFDDGRAVDGIHDLRRLVTEYQERLKDWVGLDLIPLQWLHLTTQGVGFVDEVPEEDVRRILVSCQDRLRALDSFALEFNRCLVTSEGLLLLAEPAESAGAVRNAIRSAIGDVWGDGRIPESKGFHPHVSLAYSNAAGPSAGVVELVEGMRATPASVTVHAVSLIVLDRDERVYRWRTHATVPLGRGADAMGRI